MKNQEQNAALAALNSSHLCALCCAVGSRRLDAFERNELVAAGLLEARADNIAPGGVIWILTPVGQLASRAGRLAEIVRGAEFDVIK
tara:strand:+ start:135 stop:395 length:261 start_codon:yes stop_codon:yes gene_type:complete